MNRLSVKNVSKSFPNIDKSLKVIENVSLEVEENKIVGIIGPSGCGKTTLFNIISAIIPYDSGKITIEGKSINSKHGICGYMFQEPLLFPWMKAVENIMLAYEVKNISKDKAQEKAISLLEDFGLLQFADYYPYQLSGGMKQRIALLRTVAFNSKLLLLDEPFGSIDAITRLDLHYYLMEIWEKLNLTILFTTHDIREAIFLSDRIYVLSQQPATILEIIKVDLDRPRRIEQLTTKKAVVIEKKLIQSLKNS
jgi:ABC-type nitrate/sulfonate/bicarbonate transport system ATPase subunit